MEKLSLDPGLSKIEAIVSNNDAMALGALNLLQSLGYNQDNANLYIPLIGVDAIEDAVTAVRQGTMLGTVRNDAKAQAQAVIDIASDPKRVSARDRIIQVPYSKVTQ